MSAQRPMRISMRAATPISEQRSLELLQASAFALADQAQIAVHPHTRHLLEQAALRAWTAWREAKERSRRAPR